jgi:RNA polymerase sigma-70 factor (ECF subfamily)
VPTPTFEALVERHSAEIHAYLWRLLRDPDLASDGLQDTFLRALQAFPRLRHHDHLRAWLYTIATHRARTLQREQARRAQRQTDLRDDLPAPQGASGQPGEDRELRRRVLSAVDRLPEKQRQALILRRYQGLKYDEIAAVTGGTPAAARSNVHLAQVRLREWLRAEDRDPDRTGRARGAT